VYITRTGLGNNPRAAISNARFADNHALIGAHSPRRLLNCFSVTSSRKPDQRVLPPLWLANIGQLLTLRSASRKPGPRRGPDLKELGIIENGAVLCLGGKIVSVGTTRDALRDPWGNPYRYEFDVLLTQYRILVRSAGPDGIFDSRTRRSWDDVEEWTSSVRYFTRESEALAKALAEQYTLAGNANDALVIPKPMMLAPPPNARKVL